MKILYSARFDIPEEIEIEKKVTQALVKLGNEVICRPYQECLLTGINESIDMLLLSKDQPRNWEKGIQLAQSTGIPVICWNWDLYYGLEVPRLKRSIPEMWKHVDMLFTTDGGENHERYLIDGVKWHKPLYAGISNKDYHFPAEYEYTEKCYKYQLAFVGKPYYPYRMNLIRWLKRNYGNRFIHIEKCYGNNLTETLKDVQIVVGDSYPVPYYWSNRIYEIIGRGSLFLHPFTSGLSCDFRDDFHYGMFPRDRQFEALAKTIRYYLDNWGWSKKVRKAGWEHCSSFTYEKRCQTLLEEVITKLV